MDIFQELGFKNEKECELYEDVCCEFNVEPEVNNLDDLLRILEDEATNGIELRTKKDYENMIIKNNLMELFNKVKYMSLLDRYVELYIYHANCFSIADKILKIKLSELNKAKSLCNGERMVELIAESRKLFDISKKHLCCISYIIGKVRIKIPFEEDFFFMSINNIHNEIFNGGNNGIPPIKNN